MNSSESGHTQGEQHQGEPIPTTGSCGSSEHGSCGGASPPAEIRASDIIFVSSAETPVIAPVTHEVVAAATEITPLPIAPAPVEAHAPVPVVAAPAPVVVAEAAPAPAPTAVATLEAPKPKLAESAANDLAAALATAQRARTRAKSNSRGPRPSDLIEKKIVIRRDRWDALVQLTETLRSERAVKAEPSEVAAIVLEAGLGAIIEDARATRSETAPAPVATPAKGKAKAPKPVLKVLESKKAAKPAKALTGKAARRLKARAPKPTRAAPAKPRAFKAEELDAMKRLVRGLNSDRSIQRTLALWLGAHPVKGGLAVPIEDLRSLCREFKVYDTANFAQNMKKDSSFFIEVRDKTGDRLGYSLTAAGVQACSGLFATAK